MSGHNEHSGYYTGDIHNQFVEEHHDPKNKKVIWRTFWILLVLTIVEVGIGFKASLFPSKDLLMWIFIVLTIIKAYFIIYFFMHLKHEQKALQASILVPFVLIGYLIFIALTEGNYIHAMHNWFK